MNKNNRTVLTEKQFELLSDEQKIEKLNYYLSLLNEASHEMLSFEEKLLIFKNIVGNILYFSHASDNPYLKYLHFLDSKYLEDAKFYYLFIYCDYCNDLEGNNEHRHLFEFPFSESIFTQSSNKINVNFLNSIYIQWNQELNYQNHTGLLKGIVDECNLMRRKEKNKFEKQDFERDKWEFKEKQLILFYKYMRIRG